MIDRTIHIGNVRDLFDYNPETGIFHWKVSASSTVKGSVAGSPGARGYVLIGWKRHKFSAHRVAWMHYYGEPPPEVVDHINGVKTDNRICNLRAATNQSNTQNQRRAPSHNKSTGVLGVTAKDGKYIAQISLKGKKIHLGSYRSTEAAHEAYLKAKREIHEGCTL